MKNAPNKFEGIPMMIFVLVQEPISLLFNCRLYRLVCCLDRFG